MDFGTILIRPRAWWFNKIPLSVMLFLLLVDGQPFTATSAAALLGLLAVVSSVANYGYAINEAFDLSEDKKGGRANVASALSSIRLWAIISISAVSACGIAALLAGFGALIVTIAALLLPLAYSVPPVRLKERGWYGVFADAAAAHVFPALLALLVVSRQFPGSFHLPIVAAVVLWAAATGLRGILTHQLQSESHDRAAGLVTVVHRIGYARLRFFVVFAILPIELASFTMLILLADIKIILKFAACAYVIYEYCKVRLQVFPVIVFNKAGERYIPFVDEGFYKVWGPLAIAADAALVHPVYLLLLPLCSFAFWPRVAWEKLQIALTARAILAHISQLRHQSELARLRQ